MQYSLIDMGNISPTNIETVEKAYQLWKENYSFEFQSRGLSLREDDFWNTRLLAVITNKDEVIAVHLYNSFDLRTSVAKSHSYFGDITDTRIEAFKASNAQTLMSMEYLLVNPKYRGKKSEVRWGDVLIGLGFQVLKHSPWDAMVGIARMDKGVNSMGVKMGCHETDSLTKNQTPCRVMFMLGSEVKPHENPYTQNVINELWHNKINHTPWISNEPHQHKQVA